MKRREFIALVGGGDPIGQVARNEGRLEAVLAGERAAELVDDGLASLLRLASAVRGRRAAPLVRRGLGQRACFGIGVTVCINWLAVTGSGVVMRYRRWGGKLDGIWSRDRFFRHGHSRRCCWARLAWSAKVGLPWLVR